MSSNKKRWCKFSKERGSGVFSSSESDEEPIRPTTAKNKEHSRNTSSSLNKNLSTFGVSLASKHTRNSDRRQTQSKTSKSDENLKSPAKPIGKTEIASVSCIGPTLQLHLLKNDESSAQEEIEGPPLPPHLLKNDESSAQEEIVGPRLPAHFLKNDEASIQEEIEGPPLPPHLLKNNESSAKEEIVEPRLPAHFFKNDEASIKEDIEGPPLPPHLLINDQSSAQEEIEGPPLPPHLLKIMDSSKKDPVIGPAMPPHFSVENTMPDEAVGPSLPPHLIASTSRNVIGPELPPGFSQNQISSDEEDYGAVGPDPRLMSTGEFTTAAELDERAARARRKMLGLDKEEKQERDSWMLELPPEKAAIIGLGPRQFRQKLAPEMGDRSVWTDTPTDSARKQKMPPKLDDKAIIQQKQIAERDRMMEKLAKKAEKKLKRKESLLEMHAKKMKKKSKEEEKTREGEPAERKRFNREEDLQVHRFDEAQKKAIFKRAQLLNDRFSKGESKYL